MPDRARLFTDFRYSEAARAVEGVFDEPTELAVAHDGRVFVIERHGTLSVFDPATHGLEDVDCAHHG